MPRDTTSCILPGFAEQNVQFFAGDGSSVWHPDGHPDRKITGPLAPADLQLLCALAVFYDGRDIKKSYTELEQLVRTYNGKEFDLLQKLKDEYDAHGEFQCVKQSFRIHS